MVGSTNVVTRNQGDKSSGAVLACGLETTEGIGLDGGGGTVSIAACLNSSVDTGSVGSPHFDVCVGHRLARRSVDNIDI